MAKVVVVLNHFAVPTDGPGGTRHVELFDRLAGWSYRLIIADRNLLSRQRVRPSDTSTIAVPTVPYRGNSPMRVLNWISYSIGAFLVGVSCRRIDLVYASSPHLLAGLAGWGVARIRGTPFILEIRDLWPQILADAGRLRKASPLFRLLKALESFLYRRADRIVVLASGVGGALVEEGVDQARLVYIPNGADPALFEVEEGRRHLRGRFGMNGLVFAYTGAHGPANGLFLLLDAAAKVSKHHPDIELWLVGDGVEKPTLMQTARQRGLDNVRFLGPVPKHEMAKVLAAADVGLHILADLPLFRYGVSPNKLFDYMASGLPVITNCPGEVSHIVEQAGAGLAAPPDGLASAIEAMASAGEEQRKEWGKAGRDFVEANHSRALLASRLERLLEEVITGK